MRLYVGCGCRRSSECEMLLGTYQGSEATLTTPGLPVVQLVPSPRLAEWVSMKAVVLVSIIAVLHWQLRVERWFFHRCCSWLNRGQQRVPPLGTTTAPKPLFLKHFLSRQSSRITRMKGVHYANETEIREADWWQLLLPKGSPCVPGGAVWPQSNPDPARWDTGRN